MKKKIKIIKNNCKNKNLYNETPDDLISSDGKKNYAYVTFIYSNIQIAGAIVLADSLRKLGSLSDIVIFISLNISLNCIDILKTFFDNIIKINEDIKQETEIDLIKLHSLNLTNYKKILLINPDSIILKHPDHLFTLNTPASIYLNNCENGNKLSKKIIDNMINNNNFKDILSDDFLLIRPNRNEYNDMLKNKDKQQNLMLYLLKKHNESWSHISSFFIGYDNLTDWTGLNGIQFIKNKPYILENKVPLEQRIYYDTYQLWYKFYGDLINRYPKLLDFDILKEPNQISKYFIASLSRKIMKFKKILSGGLEESVGHIFNIKNPKNYYYYHINISKEYDNDEINYLFEDDYILNMINGILKKTKSIYWSKILNDINDEVNIKNIFDNTNSNKINSQLLSKLKIEDKENILSYYAKINSNVCLIMIITTPTNENNFWLDNNLISNILYQKDIKLSGFTLKNILFNITQIYSYNEREKYLNSLYNNLTEYKIKLIFYKTVIDCNLKSNNANIYVFSNTNSKVRVLSILLNENSLNKFINKQIIFIPEKQNKLYKTLIENKTYVQNMLMFQSLKKWIYNNYDGNEMDNIIVVSNLKLSDEQLMTDFIILDTNIYSVSDDILYLKYVKRKLHFMDVIFTNKISQKDKKYIKYEEIINNIHNLRYFYQLDGIKFSL
jgi:hypothetical protein